MNQGKVIQSNPFDNWDVIGCGWNKATKSVFFTKNGEMIGTQYKLYIVQMKINVFLQKIQSNLTSIFSPSIHV